MAGASRTPPTALTFVSPQGRRRAADDRPCRPRQAAHTKTSSATPSKPTRATSHAAQLNGFAATHFVGTQQASNGQAQTIEATIVTGPQQLNYALLYLAADAGGTRSGRSPGLNAVEQSFRAMSATDTRAARPWQVQRGALPARRFCRAGAPAAPTAASRRASCACSTGCMATAADLRAGRPGEDGGGAALNRPAWPGMPPPGPALDLDTQASLWVVPEAESGYFCTIFHIVVH